jgi:hypothetical protein
MMDRVVVTCPFLGICHMQVCAERDATDEEILEVCNRENPAGTINGWSHVIRQEDEYNDKKSLPVQCADDPSRMHFLVAC